MRRTARSLEDCLMADAGLARLTDHAQHLLRLQRLFQAATPLARQARIANLRLGKILIHAANGAVAAKLRQMEPRLTGIFFSEAREVTGIEVRVQPRAKTHLPVRPSDRAPPGDSQKQALTRFADSLRPDSPLKTALVKLVGRS